MHHEQSLTMAMQTYYRVTKKIGVALVTAGGASANAITGVISAWADSMPGTVISGQENLKYVKKLKGEETLEAKTDLSFEVKNNVHSRFDALSRTYKYFIINRSFQNFPKMRLPWNSTGVRSKKIFISSPRCYMVFDNIFLNI